MTSLRSIHLVFIVTSIALAVMVAVWAVVMYLSHRGEVGHLAFAVGSVLSGAAMNVYLVAFIRKTRQIGIE